MKMLSRAVNSCHCGTSTCLVARQGCSSPSSGVTTGANSWTGLSAAERHLPRQEHQLRRYSTPASSSSSSSSPPQKIFINDVPYPIPYKDCTVSQVFEKFNVPIHLDCRQGKCRTCEMEAVLRGSNASGREKDPPDTGTVKILACQEPCQDEMRIFYTLPDLVVGGNKSSAALSSTVSNAENKDVNTDDTTSPRGTEGTLETEPASSGNTRLVPPRKNLYNPYDAINIDAKAARSVHTIRDESGRVLSKYNNAGAKTASRRKAKTVEEYKKLRLQVEEYVWLLDEAMGDFDKEKECLEGMEGLFGDDALGEVEQNGDSAARDIRNPNLTVLYDQVRHGSRANMLEQFYLLLAYSSFKDISIVAKKRHVQLLQHYYKDTNGIPPENSSSPSRDIQF
ncbi:unnamed protein product [Amoebophrya sp. A120]|nr:unnamed protein product [Amoebophrya sp. A120]|eukprot:GSA120T00004564001.1